MSLMASEAVVDSRDYDVLTAEETEDLKAEHTALTLKLTALTKKLALETKIRDAAISLSKVNSAQKRVSKHSEDQLASANGRVETVQRDLWKISQRAHEVSQRLLEHRAAVLSISVRNMEKKMATTNGSEDSGYDSSNRSTLMSPATATSTFSASSRQSKFDGAHLFAGHEKATVPRKKLSPEAASKEIAGLEERLKQATASLAESSKIQAEMKKELSHLKLEKQEIETTMGLDLQTAESTIASLEPRLEDLDEEVRILKAEREEERRRLDEANARVQELEMGVAEKTGGAEKMLLDMRESHRAELAEKEEQLQKVKHDFDEERASWERDRNALEDEKMDDLARLHQEMDQLRQQDEQVLQQANNELNLTLQSLRKIVQQFSIPLAQRSSQTSAMQHMLDAITKHLGAIHDRMEQLEKAGSENGPRARQLEAELQSVLEKRDAIAKELEETKRERDAARRETMASSTSSSSMHDGQRSRGNSIKSPPMPIATLATPETSEFGPDVEGAKFIAALQPLWAVLPSPEARAAKFSANSARAYRSPSATGATPSSPGGSFSWNAASQAPSSLSELDVRSLKALYDAQRREQSAGTANGQFTLESFMARVQALIVDDRALIERLIRFAQAHDLLKKNAERAQKLAQDGNVALETYQKQVKSLEARNTALSANVIALQDELRLVHNGVERLTAEKHQLEAFAAEQAETCQQLSEANDVLSARALTLAEEAANAPEMVRKQLDECKKQLEDNKKALDDKSKELEDARDEIDAMRSAEQGQRIALLDELNSMQTENGQLRAQLRAAKK